MAVISQTSFALSCADLSAMCSIRPNFSHSFVHHLPNLCCFLLIWSQFHSSTLFISFICLTVVPALLEYSEQRPI
jgi:hypothetical protein